MTPRHLHRLPGLVLKDHELVVPLDHASPGGETLRIFAREVVSPDLDENRDLPWLVFLPGGPGFASQRPDGRGGWLGRALKEFRVLLPDPRGTGLSAPVDCRTLLRRGTPAEQAAYLKHFRSDSIVRDAEAFRQALTGGAPWTVLGQSFGGFCAASYLSIAPEGLREVLITGGIPPIGFALEDVYRETHDTCRAKNRAYYDRYPGDVERVAAIVEHLKSRAVPLPSGGTLTPERFLQLGIHFGFSAGFELVHGLVEQAFVEGPDGPELGYAFLRAFENALNFDTNPIYSLLHEPIYCEGTASRWAAARVMAERPEFSLEKGGPYLFRGETVHLWFFDEYPTLRALKEVAHILAETSDWGKLYDPAALARNAVPAATAVYANDMYVPCRMALAVAAKIRGMRVWLTNELEHDGIRSSGDAVLERLIAMARGMA